MNGPMAISRALSQTRTLPVLINVLNHWRMLLALALIAVLGVAVDRWVATGVTSSTTPVVSYESVQQFFRYGTRPGGPNPAIDVLFATPSYYATLREPMPSKATGAPSHTFFVTETTHFGALASDLPQPQFRMNGGSWVAASDSAVTADSEHHRTTMLRFPAPDAGGSGNAFASGRATFELLFPSSDGAITAGNLLAWDLSSAEFTATTASELKLTWVSGLGLLGGFLAAMWPCLFQLTVFFIPGMAGISMSEARKSEQAPAIQARVLKTALFFVLGIVIVYTLAGAAAGLAAQSLSGSSIFETWRRPLTLFAGLVIIGMAVRVAVRGRAPLVCKMPIVSHMAGKGPSGPLATMATGLAFATGCMTCFGAAMALGMLTYVVSSASWLSGALLMFVFSLGISIPLVAASVAMSRALPILYKLERYTPWMALFSSTIMIVFALLLMSDNYHVISDVASRTVKLLGS